MMQIPRKEWNTSDKWTSNVLRRPRKTNLDRPQHINQLTPERSAGSSINQLYHGESPMEHGIMVTPQVDSLP
jgi:hypothetical protein